MTNLEQSGSWIPEAWSLKLTYPLITFFNLTKNENKTLKSLTQPSYYCFEKVLYLPKSADFLQKKNAEINKIKEVLVLKGIFSETIYKCVLTYQNLANSNKF